MIIGEFYVEIGMQDAIKSPFHVHLYILARHTQ
jgi:hypothetical protein